MTEATPTRKLSRRRERKDRRITDKTATAAYNRDGLDACCKALGAGESSDWPQEDGDE